MGTGAVGLAVKVLTPDRPGGWRSAFLDSFTGQVLVDGKPVPAGRVWGITHDHQRQTPHESPDPKEMGWWVLIAMVLFPEKRRELETAAGWRDATGQWVHCEGL